jgi:APA family basic amino acid/polyamine antiporter
MSSQFVTGETPRQRSGQLLQILGVTFAIAITVGGTIGVGILRTPGSVAATLGNTWLIIGIWTLGGIYALLGTIASAELTTSLSQAGGWYVYARRAFGEYTGFTVGWINWIAYCTGLAAIVVAMGEYGAKLMPSVYGGALTISLFVMCFLFALHWSGLRVGCRAQEIMSVVSAAGFVMLIAACFILGGRHEAVGTSPTVVAAPATVSALFITLAIAFQSVIFTYDGWYGAIYFSEECTNQGRGLPRAMIGSVLVVIAIYLLVNLALLYVLPIADIAGSQLAAADAAARVFGESSGTVVTTIAFLSLMCITNSALMQTPRILFAMSRDNLFFSGVSRVNKGGTPDIALLVTTVVTMALILIGSFDRLLAITSFFFVAMYLSGFMALIALRKNEPDLPRPFRSFGYPWTIYTLVALSAVFIAGVLISDMTNSLLAVAALLISYPIYRMVKRLKS